MWAYRCLSATCPSSPLCSVGGPKHLSCRPILPHCCDCGKHVTVSFNGQSKSQACHFVPSFRLMCTPTGQALSPTGPLNDTPQCSVAFRCAPATQKYTLKTDTEACQAHEEAHGLETQTHTHTSSPGKANKPALCDLGKRWNGKSETMGMSGNQMYVEFSNKNTTAASVLTSSDPPSALS